MMANKRDIIFLGMLVVWMPLQAKTAVSAYYRNAITSMMVYHPEDEFGYEVFKIFKRLPDLDKYDNHDIQVRVIDNSYISGVEGSSSGLNKQVYGQSMVLTAEEKEANGQALLSILEKGEVAKRMIAKWFNLTGDSVQNSFFNTQLLEDRLEYNTSVMEAEKIKYTVEGRAALQDVSEQLIEHSFVLVSDITYITAENRADAAKTAFSILGGITDAIFGGNAGRNVAALAGGIADKFTGFKVMTHTYLYQIEWNDSLMNEFYVRYFTPVPNAERMRAFVDDKTSFHLRYLGEESSVFEKTEVKGKYDRTQLLEFITARSIDKNVASLQTKYEDFRVKSPITAVEYTKNGKIAGYRALIGEKEDISSTSTFEVLEPSLEDGKIVYHRIGTVKPASNQIWDNRFNALMENDVDVSTEGTLFKTVGKNTQPIEAGMLLRLLKQK